MLYHRLLQNVEHFIVFKNIGRLFYRICVDVLLDSVIVYKILQNL